MHIALWHYCCSVIQLSIVFFIHFGFYLLDLIEIEANLIQTEVAKVLSARKIRKSFFSSDQNS